MFIVATAGHIDHGKTSLVRALTGVETDRLPEEQARGISIDLGFAYWEPQEGALLAFVDVPGHHRFIRNMLAGVAAVHFAMLVVAADDGPMPQTLEHLRILDFLGVAQGVVVLTKADCVASERLSEVADVMQGLLAETSLAGLPVMAASARDGSGIAQLQQFLAQAARAHEASRSREPAASRLARTAIDRVFTIRGAGTVVTGTVYDGLVRREDRLTLWPAGIEVRVRGIQVHGRDVLLVRSGERAAFNLAGAEHGQISRGDWLASSDAGPTSQWVDVQLSTVEDAPPLKHASRARFYVGATELGCRVLLPAKAEADGGQTLPARLHLDGPVLAVAGDRFVLRDGSGSATLGGGSVVNPIPVSRRKFMTGAEFDAFAGADPGTVLKTLLALQGIAGVDMARFARIFLLTSPACENTLQACDTVVRGKARPVAIGREEDAALAVRIARVLIDDERPSRRVAELRDTAAHDMTMDAFEHFLRTHSERLDVSLSGGFVTLRTRQEAVRSADLQAWERVRPMLAQAGLKAMDVQTLAGTSGVPAARLRPILHAQARAGEVFALQAEKFIARDVVARLATAAAATAARSPGGTFTAAQYRDSIGTGRTLAIQILEALDAAGITRRAGDQRTILRDPETVFGHVPPFQAMDSTPTRSCG